MRVGKLSAELVVMNIVNIVEGNGEKAVEGKGEKGRGFGLLTAC
jgi:hypothetical protein